MIGCSICTISFAAEGDSETAPETDELRRRTTGTSVVRDRNPVVQKNLRLERGAILNGLQYLSSKQENSGAIGDHFPVAVTSLAGLAFLGAGSGYTRGPYAQEIQNCLRYVLASVHGSSGFISEKKPVSRMHGHGFALLFLTQVYGHLPELEQGNVAHVVRRGIRCVRLAQSSLGGWSYLPEDSATKNDDEASVTIGVIQALRAADNVGFTVDKRIIGRAIRYVKKSQTGDGSFRYSLNPARGANGGKTSFALTAAATSTLNAAGIYESKELLRGLDFMDRRLSGSRGQAKRAVEDPFFFYGALYASQTYFQAGGSAWSRWYTELRSYLLKKQRTDGRWSDQAYGDEFGTASAVLILAMPIQYLPIYQR